MDLRRILAGSFALAALAGCSDGGKAHTTHEQSATSTASKATVVIDPADVERSLVQQFADRRLPLKSASCPDEVSSAIGDETTCDIDFSDGAFGNVTVKVLDGKGRVEIVGFSRSLAKPPGS